MIRSFKYIFLTAFAAFPLAVQAADLPPEITRDVMLACKPDYHRICSEVLPGEGRVGRCLQAHEEDLSPGCLKAVKFAYAIEACSADYHRFCEGVRPGGGNIVQCLSERSYDLAPACSRVVAANAPYVSGGETYKGDHAYNAGRDHEHADHDAYAYSERPHGERYRDRGDRDRFAGGHDVYGRDDYANRSYRPHDRDPEVDEYQDLK